MNKLRIALLFGGKSPEHEVSLRSAKAIFHNLDQDKYEVYPIPLTKNNMCLLSLDEDSQEMSFDVGYEILETGMITKEQEKEAYPASILSYASVDLIIPIIHGSFGEDGKLQGMLDMLEIPYIGAGVLGSAIGMDKEVQKILVAHLGIKMAPFQTYRLSTWKKDAQHMLTHVKEHLQLPYFVKPANAGSSMGITKVKDLKMLSEAIETAFQYDSKILVEEGLTNIREIESAVIGHNTIEVAPALSEIIPDREFYDYDSKYDVSSTSQVIIPALVSIKEQEEIAKTAQQIYEALQCSGLARVDLFLDQNSTIYFNEINTLPGFTPTSAFSKMWAASGISYPELLDKLIALALEKNSELQKLRYVK